MPSVFVSHSTKDRVFVEAEIVALLKKHGVQVFYSPTSIRTQEQWERRILGGLQACDYFIIVMSPIAAQSEWVKDELHWAIAHRAGNVIPIMHKKCDPLEFHLRLPRIQYIDFANDKEIARRNLLECFGIRLDAESTVQDSRGSTRLVGAGSTRFTGIEPVSKPFE